MKEKRRWTSKQLLVVAVMIVTNGAWLGCRTDTPPIQHASTTTHLNEQQAILQAKQVRTEAPFPSTQTTGTGVIHISLPSSERDIPATLQTQVRKISDADYQVIFTEWWSASDFHKVIQLANGAMEQQNDAHEMLTHTWRYEVTPDQTTILQEAGDYPPQYVN